jgi:hypothetical protein
MRSRGVVSRIVFFLVSFVSRVISRMLFLMTDTKRGFSLTSRNRLRVIGSRESITNPNHDIPTQSAKASSSKKTSTIVVLPRQLRTTRSMPSTSSFQNQSSEVMELPGGKNFDKTKLINSSWHDSQSLQWRHSNQMIERQDSVPGRRNVKMKLP